ncbi:MAG: hypothetical protein AABW45_02865 [Nanoarchaeota archaeon]
MNRREFLSVLPFLGYLYQEEQSDLSKIVNYIKKVKEISIIIDGKGHKHHELPIKDKDGLIKYTLQSNDIYFAVINHKKKYFLFDFNKDGNVDIYIKDTYVNDGSIVDNMDYAIEANNKKSSRNKNLRIVTNLEDEANKLFYDELKELSSLLKI